MNRKEWEGIDRARQLLQLGDRATLGEIKRAYHRLCKRHHPDIQNDGGESDNTIYRLTEAYELLMRYCNEYRFPLRTDEVDIYDAEEWWMDRFGQDPLWGGKRKKR